MLCLCPPVVGSFLYDPVVLECCVLVLMLFVYICLLSLFVRVVCKGCCCIVLFGRLISLSGVLCVCPPWLIAFCCVLVCCVFAFVSCLIEACSSCVLFGLCVIV